jgi:hypothetical protein
MGVLLLPNLVVCAAEDPTGLRDLTRATIVSGQDSTKVSAMVLAEEVEKRTGLSWPVLGEPPTDGWAVFLLTPDEKTPSSWRVPEELGVLAAEGYAIRTPASESGSSSVWIAGADRRGVLFGVGRFLRLLEWSKGRVRLSVPLDVSSAPAYPIRGHQLGYRARANSYDAWDPAQYDQYIRELTFFGVNCVENIPFEDQRQSPVMKHSREEMNLELSRICARYDLDYWVWSPAPFDLNDTAQRSDLLAKHETFFANCPRLDAVFFPGGDPGHNHPQLVMPFLEELSGLLIEHHPHAKVWISLQGFDAERVDYFYAWLLEHEPDWLGGVVAGPSSPPIPETRARLPRRYGLRHYPDITHTVRCQYPTPWWDPAFAFTLGTGRCA